MVGRGSDNVPVPLTVRPELPSKLLIVSLPLVVMKASPVPPKASVPPPVMTLLPEPADEGAHRRSRPGG